MLQLSFSSAQCRQLQYGSPAFGQLKQHVSSLSFKCSLESDRNADHSSESTASVNKPLKRIKENSVACELPKYQYSTADANNFPLWEKKVCRLNFPNHADVGKGGKLELHVTSVAPHKPECLWPFLPVPYVLYHGGVRHIIPFWLLLGVYRPNY